MAASSGVTVGETVLSLMLRAIAPLSSRSPAASGDYVLFAMLALFGWGLDALRHLIGADPKGRV